MRALCEHESQLEREERLKADRERKRKRRHSMNDNEREDKGAEDTERFKRQTQGEKEEQRIARQLAHAASQRLSRSKQRFREIQATQCNYLGTMDTVCDNCRARFFTGW